MPRNVPEAEGFSGAKRRAYRSGTRCAECGVHLSAAARRAGSPATKARSRHRRCASITASFRIATSPRPTPAVSAFITRLAFRLFGVNLFSLRLAVFGVFLLWGSRGVLHRSPLHPAAGGFRRHGDRDCLELSQLRCGDALLVQPLLRDIRQRCRSTLSRHAQATLADSGRCLRRHLDGG